jgi:hypothetical protein
MSAPALPTLRTNPVTQTESMMQIQSRRASLAAGIGPLALALALACSPALAEERSPVAASKVEAALGGVTASIRAAAGKHGLRLQHASKTIRSIDLFPGQGIVLVAGGAVHDDTDSDGLLDAGESIDYHYTVLNLGDAALSSLALTDLAGAVSCPQTTLAIGAHMVCTRSYAITGADATAGAVINTVEVQGQDAGARAVQAVDVLFTQNLAAAADIRVFKSPQVVSDADASGGITAGDLLRYTFVVKNGGAEALSSVGLVEPDPDRIDTPVVCEANTLDGVAFGGNGSGALASSDTVRCTADYTVRASDASLGQVLNLVQASGTAPVAGPISASGASAVVAGVGQISLDKAIQSGNPYLSAGDSIVYSYTVTNTGTTPLAGPVTVNDDRVAVSCPALSTIGDGDDIFDVGETLVCSATYLVTLDDVLAGSVTNTAQAFAGGVASNIDTATAMRDGALPVPVIGVSKALGSLTGSDPYQVRFDIVVRNYGAVDLSDVQVVEDLRQTFPLPVQFSVTSLLVNGTAVANAGFDGETDLNLLDPSQSTLAVDAEIGIALTIELNPQGERGPFFNTVTASGRDVLDTVVSDDSVAGANPDPDGDGIPDEATPTPITFPGGPVLPRLEVIPSSSFWSLLLLGLLVAGFGFLRRP